MAMEIRRQIIRFLLKPLQYLFILLAALGILAVFFGYQIFVQSPLFSGSIERLSTFSTIFLGIFIEAVPFLLLGTLASGFAEVYLSTSDLQRLIPSKALPAATFGSSMGIFFPVCECGVIPLTRRLFQKGLPIATGMAFLMASPVINPISIASTAAAFGIGPALYLRVGITLLIALATGLLFAHFRKTTLLQTLGNSFEFDLHSHDLVENVLSNKARIRKALIISVDEFFEMSRYLIIGAILAALMQTFIPQNTFLQMSQGPIISIFVMMALAVILSVCSTVDAFIALSFASMFSPGAILAFLIFGPIVDIKSTMMYLRVFHPSAVISIIGISFTISFLAGVVINLLWAGI